MVFCYSRTSNFPNIPGTQEIKEPLTSDRPLMRFVLAIRAPGSLIAVFSTKKSSLQELPKPCKKSEKPTGKEKSFQEFRKSSGKRQKLPGNQKIRQEKPFPSGKS
jgi:hypothetical protein